PRHAVLETAVLPTELRTPVTWEVAFYYASDVLLSPTPHLILSGFHDEGCACRIGDSTCSFPGVRYSFSGFWPWSSYARHTQRKPESPSCLFFGYSSLASRQFRIKAVPSIRVV